jgi:rubrerythrin
MEITQSQLLEFIRAIHARPNGTGALLNLVRASEVRGAADLSALTEVIDDDALRRDVTRHAADEARHANILVRRMNEIGFAPFRLPEPVDRTEGIAKRCKARDPKTVYAARGIFDPEETYEILLAASIAEKDAVPKLQANYTVLESDPRTQATIGSILRDEGRHVEYLGDWVARYERRLSAGFVAETRNRLMEAFVELNMIFYAAFEEYLVRAEHNLAA